MNFTSLTPPTLEQLQEAQTNKIYVYYYNNFKQRLMSKFGYGNYPKGFNTLKHEEYLIDHTTDALLRWKGDPRPEYAYTLPYVSLHNYRDFYGRPSGYILGLTENTEHDRIPSDDYVIFYDTVQTTRDCRTTLNAIEMFAYWAYEVHNVFRSNLMHQNKPFILATTPQTKMSSNNFWHQFSSFVPYINMLLKKGQKAEDIGKQMQTVDLRVEFHGKELADILMIIVNMVDGRIDMNSLAGRDRVTQADFAVQCNQAVIDNMARFLARKQAVEEANERGLHSEEGEMYVYLNGYNPTEVRPYNNEYFENKTLGDVMEGDE